MEDGVNRVHFSSQTCHWGTPKEIFKDLDREFNFNDDPCSLKATPLTCFWDGCNTYCEDGLDKDWGARVFLNPPYGRDIGKWIRKAYSESKKGKLVVCLIPSRTDTSWWHDYVMKADEIRFIRGRLKFNGAKNNAPFPSAVVVFNGDLT